MRVTGDEELKDVWVFLTPNEAREVLEAFQSWANGEEGFRGPGWHMHLTEGHHELTLAIDPSHDPD